MTSPLPSNQQETIMDLEKVLERIPGFRAAKAEDTEAHVGGRRALVADLERIGAERKKAVVAPQKDIASATSKVENTREALAEAELALPGAHLVLQQINLQADTAQARIRETLRAGAIPGIWEFLDELSGLWDGERLRWESDALKRDGVPMPAQERIDQINGARARAERLFFEPDPVVAERELERLRDAVALPTPKEEVAV